MEAAARGERSSNPRDDDVCYLFLQKQQPKPEYGKFLTKLARSLALSLSLLSFQVARVSCPGPPASTWARQTVSSVRFFVFMYVIDTSSTGSQGRTWRLPACPPLL